MNNQQTLTENNSILRIKILFKDKYICSSTIWIYVILITNYTSRTYYLTTCINFILKYYILKEHIIPDSKQK